MDKLFPPKTKVVVHRRTLPIDRIKPVFATLEERQKIMRNIEKAIRTAEGMHANSGLIPSTIGLTANTWGKVKVEFASKNPDGTCLFRRIAMGLVVKIIEHAEEDIVVVFFDTPENHRESFIQNSGVVFI